jgi:hypothetical protein
MKDASFPIQQPAIPGFVRKGKALVFSAPGGETLSDKTVQDILKSGQAERDARVVERLKGRNRRR